MLRSQESYSTLWDGFATAADAKAARDKRYRVLRRSGIPCRRWTLLNQLKTDFYGGLGTMHGGLCDCYMLDIFDAAAVVKAKRRAKSETKVD